MSNVIVKDFSDLKLRIAQNIKNSIMEFSEILDERLKENLMSNRTADGDSQPSKAELTKKIYRENNWDTENWLHRTGKSTSFYTEKKDDGFNKRLPDWDDSPLQYLEETGDWFAIANRDVKDLSELIIKNINREFGE